MSRRSIQWNRFCLGLLVGMTAAGCFDTARVPTEATIGASAGSTSATSVDITIRVPYIIEVTGSKFRWQVKYPGADGTLMTDDDVLTVGNLHVPAQTDVELVLKSADYVDSLALPHFEQHEMAVPGLEFRLRFHTADDGEFELLGDEFCGDPHPELNGSLFVESPDRFRKWLGEQMSRTPAELSP